MAVESYRALSAKSMFLFFAFSDCASTVEVL